MSDYECYKQAQLSIWPLLGLKREVSATKGVKQDLKGGRQLGLKTSTVVLFDCRMKRRESNIKNICHVEKWKRYERYNCPEKGRRNIILEERSNRIELTKKQNRNEFQLFF